MASIGAPVAIFMSPTVTGTAEVLQSFTYTSASVFGGLSLDEMNARVLFGQQFGPVVVPITPPMYRYVTESANGSEVERRPHEVNEPVILAAGVQGEGRQGVRAPAYLSAEDRKQWDNHVQWVFDGAKAYGKKYSNMGLTADDFGEVGYLALLEAWGNRDANKGNFDAYVRKILSGRFLDEVRRELRRSKQTVPLCAPSEEGEEDSLVRKIEDPSSPDPLREAGRAESNKLLSAAMSELTPKERMVIELEYFEGLTIPEVAAKMKLSETRVREVKGKAMYKLRLMLAPVPGITEEQERFLEAQVEAHRQNVVQGLPNFGDQLRPRQREVLRLRYIDGLSNVKICVKLGIDFDTMIKIEAFGIQILAKLAAMERRRRR